MQDGKYRTGSRDPEYVAAYKREWRRKRIAKEPDYYIKEYWKRPDAHRANQRRWKAKQDRASINEKWNKWYHKNRARKLVVLDESRRAQLPDYLKNNPALLLREIGNNLSKALPYDVRQDAISETYLLISEGYGLEYACKEGLMRVRRMTQENYAAVEIGNCKWL